MEPKKSCGFGTPFKNFYKPNSLNSLYLTRPIRKCESLVYGNKIMRSPFRFGKVDKKFKEVCKDIKLIKLC